MLKAKQPESERIIAIVGMIVCCGLLILAVPRLVASLYALYPEVAIKQTQENLPIQVYEKSIDDFNHALAWYDNPEYRQEQAILYLAQINATPANMADKKQELLNQAQTSIIEGLKRSPVDPYAWFRLAAVDKLLKQPPEKIIDALRLSIYAGRVEPDLVIQRLLFSYQYYNEFNDEVQKLWLKQIPVAWTFQPDQLVKFIAQHAEAQPIAEQAFAYSPDEWKKFSLALDIFTQKNL